MNDKIINQIVKYFTLGLVSPGENELDNTLRKSIKKRKKKLKKPNNNKQKKLRNKKMKILKNFKLLVLSYILIAVIVTGVALNKQKNIDVNNCASVEIQVKESFSGTSEFFYKPEDDSRTWHVVNKYSSGLSKTSPEYNYSEYTFTNESVTVENNFVGVNTNDFIANK